MRIRSTVSMSSNRKTSKRICRRLVDMQVAAHQHRCLCSRGGAVYSFVVAVGAGCKSRIDFLYCFENKRGIFNIHRMFKFVIFGTTKGGKTKAFKCAFMEHDPLRLPSIEANALEMTTAQVRRFSPTTLGIMEFVAQADMNATDAIYADHQHIADATSAGWNICFDGELHLTNYSYLFSESPTKHPLYEGKMIWQFDGEFEQPRYWLDFVEVTDALGERAAAAKHYRLGFRDVAANTNERTLVATIIPPTFHGNTITTLRPPIIPESSEEECLRRSLFLAALFNSFAIDFVIRQKVTNHLNFFYMDSLPIMAVDHAASASMMNHIVARVARLVCTGPLYARLWSTVYQPEWCDATLWGLSGPDGYGPQHEIGIRDRLIEQSKGLGQTWTPAMALSDRADDRRDTGDRAQIRAELDAIIAHVLGLDRAAFENILGKFPVLERKEQKAFGEFMSKRKCLEEYDRIGAIL